MLVETEAERLLALVDRQGQLQQKGRSLAMVLPGLVCSVPALRSPGCHLPAFPTRICVLILPILKDSVKPSVRFGLLGPREKFTTLSPQSSPEVDRITTLSA